MSSPVFVFTPAKSTFVPNLQMIPIPQSVFFGLLSGRESGTLSSAGDYLSSNPTPTHFTPPHEEGPLGLPEAPS